MLSLLSSVLALDDAADTCNSSSSPLVPLPPWALNVHDFENSMVITARLTLDSGKDATSGSLVAFVGDEVRGMGGSRVVPFGPYKGGSLFEVMIYSSRYGERLDLQYVPESLDESLQPGVFRLSPSASTRLAIAGVEDDLLFVKNSVLGDAMRPLALTRSWWTSSLEPQASVPLQPAMLDTSTQLAVEETGSYNQW